MLTPADIRLYPKSHVAPIAADVLNLISTSVAVFIKELLVKSVAKLPVLPNVKAPDITAFVRDVFPLSPCSFEHASVTAAITASFNVYFSPKITAVMAVVATLTTAPTNIAAPFSAKKAPTTARIAKSPSESINITGLFLQ